MMEYSENRNLRQYLEEYASRHSYEDTLKALRILDDTKSLIKKQDRVDYYFNNSMSIARLLIALNLPLGKKDMDRVVAAALLHTVSKHAVPEGFREKVGEAYGLDEETIRVVELITLHDNTSPEALKEFYTRLQENKLALMVRLTERSNMVERLSVVTPWKAISQIAETKKYFFPMCIYGKENYPDLDFPLSLLMEKMRSLIEVAEILIYSFNLQEKELDSEILELQEENARLRQAIRKMEE